MTDFVSGYNVIKKIGDGARSQVFQVVRPSSGEVFALKRVVRESHEDTRFLEQAITEHRIAGQLSHVYLRKALEVKRMRRFFKLVEVHVVLEYVEGVSLDKSRPDGIDEAVSLFLKVAEGLHHMHEHGFLHTDLKPNNILLQYEGQIKIIDFGQSCEIGTRKPRIQGTPDYIAPEQVERRTLTQQTDVFNLGATLYWTLTGRAYPTVISKKRRRHDVRHSAVPTPQEANPQVPSVLSRLVMECCRYERRHRPTDMRDVIGRLEIAHHVLTKERPGEAEPKEVDPHAAGDYDSLADPDADQDSRNGQ